MLRAVLSGLFSLSIYANVTFADEVLRIESETVWCDHPQVIMRLMDKLQDGYQIHQDLDWRQCQKAQTQRSDTLGVVHIITANPTAGADHEYKFWRRELYNGNTAIIIEHTVRTHRDGVSEKKT